MLLYIMLCIVLAYLMLFAALTNSVCLNNSIEKKHSVLARASTAGV